MFVDEDVVEVMLEVGDWGELSGVLQVKGRAEAVALRCKDNGSFCCCCVWFADSCGEEAIGRLINGSGGGGEFSFLTLAVFAFI